MKNNVGKWNYKTHEYDEYNPKWNLILMRHEMGELVNCAQCGKEIKFGDSYTSKEVHTHVGFGYPVCDKCYEGEVARDRLEKIRTILRNERISYGELAELESLKEYIEPGDVELLEAAGVPEND
jgi:NAD-dependent SIR2 family protein deacetylase